MDRKAQLKNVAFGGDWVEVIVPREARVAALKSLAQAVEAAAEHDPLTDAAIAALEALRGAARMDMLAASFIKAARLPDPAERCVQLDLVLRRIRSVVGGE